MNRANVSSKVIVAFRYLFDVQYLLARYNGPTSRRHQFAVGIDSETTPFLKFAQRMFLVSQATVFYGQKAVLIV